MADMFPIHDHLWMSGAQASLSGRSILGSAIKIERSYGSARNMVSQEELTEQIERPAWPHSFEDEIHELQRKNDPAIDE